MGLISQRLRRVTNRAFHFQYALAYWGGLFIKANNSQLG